MLVGTDEVWRRIIRERPFTSFYKFTPELFEISLRMIFNYPLRVANTNDPNHQNLNEGNNNSENQEVIIISDSESDTMEIEGEHEGPVIASTSSLGDTERCSTASSPFPHNAWKK